jgi:hypothetical protein
MQNFEMEIESSNINIFCIFLVLSVMVMMVTGLSTQQVPDLSFINNEEISETLRNIFNLNHRIGIRVYQRLLIYYYNSEDQNLVERLISELKDIAIESIELYGRGSNMFRLIGVVIDLLEVDAELLTSDSDDISDENV